MLFTRPYPVPENEMLRLDELRRYRVLDTEPDVILDNVVRLARSLFGTEYGVLSLIDDRRQWFKARSGIAIQETQRADAFCTYTILADQVMVVPDALEDARFRETALVKDGPHIRFYAGAPLTTPSGYNIGTVCVIGRTARSNFRTRERKQLEQLAEIAMSELNKRVADYARRTHERQLCALSGVISGYGVKPTVVDIVNISARGAMIRCSGPSLPKGDELILTIGKLVVVSTVAWAKDEMDGLAFHCPIGPVELAKLSRQINGTAKH